MLCGTYGENFLSLRSSIYTLVFYHFANINLKYVSCFKALCCLHFFVFVYSEGAAEAAAAKEE